MMRRMIIACLSVVFVLLASLSTTAAQETVYSTPTWVKGYGAVWFTKLTPDKSHIILATSTGLYMLNPDAPDAPPTVLKGHTDTIQSATFSHDGSLMATTSLDGTVRLWRIPSGEAVWNARVNDPCCTGAPPRSADFTDNDSLLLVELGTQYPAGAFVINVQSAKAERIESYIFLSGAIIHGNDLLYPRQEDDGFHAKRLQADGDDFAITDAAILPDTRIFTDFSKATVADFTTDYAVITTDKGTLAIVNLNNGSTLPPISNFPPVFYNIGNTIWGQKDNTFSAVNLDTGKRVNLSFKQVISTDNNQWLPYIDPDGIGNILDLETLEHVPVAPVSTPLAYQWSQGYLAYLSGTNIDIFNAATGKSVTLTGATAPADTINLSINVIENRVLVFFGDKPALGGIWDVTTGASIVPPMPVGNYFQSLYQALTDKNRIALAVNDSTTNKNAILLADLKAGSIRIFTSENADSPSFFIGNRVLYRGLSLLDLTSGEETHFTSEEYSGLELAFSPDSKLLATGGDTIRLWDAVTGAQVGVVGLQRNVHRMAYAERGIAALYDNNQLQFLNIPATSTPTTPLNGSGDLHDVAVEGNIIAAAGDVNVQLFALDAAGNMTAKTVLVPNASLSPVRSYTAVAMSSRYIAAAGLTANQDGSSANTVVDLWSATTWKFVQRLDSQTGGDAFDLSFSPDGTHMALTASGASVVWNMERSLDQPLFVTSQGSDSGHAFAGNILATLEQSWLKHTIDLYAISDGKPVGTLRRTVNSTGGGGGEGYRIPVAASADGLHIALVDAMGELVMWNVPDEVKQAAQNSDTGKANVIAYCDTLRGAQVNFSQSQAVNLTWSWFATDIQLVYSHMFNAIYEIKLDDTELDESKAQRSVISRDKANNNNWTVYYNLNVGALKPGVHIVNYRLTWQQAINDGITDYGPNTDHLEDTGTCTFTVN